MPRAPRPPHKKVVRTLAARSSKPAKPKGKVRAKVKGAAKKGAASVKRAIKPLRLRAKKAPRTYDLLSSKALKAEVSGHLGVTIRSVSRAAP